MNYLWNMLTLLQRLNNHNFVNLKIFLIHILAMLSSESCEKKCVTSDETGNGMKNADKNHAKETLIEHSLLIRFV